VREALRLHRDRVAAGLPAVVHEVYASRACLDRLPEFEDLAGSTRLRLATDEVLAAMADTVNPQGIVAVCSFVDVGLETVLEAAPRLIAVLCQVRDPGNAGTVLRAADAAGADAVVLTSSSVDIYNPKAVRSTAGSLFHLPVVLGVDVAELVERCQSRGMGILAADGYGTVNLDKLQDENAARRLSGEGPTSEYALESPTVWLFGNEAQGLSDGELALADHRVAVPVYGSAESLNLGTAATVCLYASARSQQPSTVQPSSVQPFTIPGR
jgi:TrmH family RNA methyltransferase